MVKKSPFAPIPIPSCNVLSFLFPPDSPLHSSTKPIWIDAADPSVHLSTGAALGWIKRLGSGLENLRDPTTGDQVVKRGEVVLIFSPNQIFVPVAYLGIVGSGRIFSGINPAYSVNEAVYQMNNTEAKVILVHPSLLETAVAAATEAGIPTERLFQFSETEVATRKGVRDWRALLASPEASRNYRWLELSETESANTVATINYSSGTTGLPKGQYGPEGPLQHRWIGFLPLYHAYGQMMTILHAVRNQVPIYLMKKFVFEDYLRVIQDYKITYLHVAPPVMVMLSKRPETAKYDLSSVVEISCGAAPLSRELQNEVAKKYGVSVKQGWGMTEVTTGAIHVPGGVDDKTGSVGVLDPNCECKLLDDNGNEVPEGEPGELYVRSPNVSIRYWKNEAATRETMLPDGWLRSGDIAICRGDWFWIVDRKKASKKRPLLPVNYQTNARSQELIKVNALQVAPAELEAALLENDDIADAAVVGLKMNDEEFPRAYVVLKESAKQRKNPLTPEQIQEWIKPRVAKHKWLTGGVALIDEVPKLPSGKIVRKVMKEWAARDAARLQGISRAKL
ncbi:predicted protein [Uncinocarpus reesii 1704]|uniref:4-coumarate-CoA ligase n=1 Tax=Uncinocarpus reesii (strain UAMH 1704) TaxID=336963 RepID=C4JQV3_UNCRE|nr:uncharacterized protein UREG_03435 [Uncinocarpus reesii 1704]EEP78589.1 predicted protein [Uncinocarpus reesii 1704]